MKAIHLDLEDRRWYIPEVTEDRWGKEQFAKFYRWLGTGGLQIIRGWSEGFGNYISTGDHAPMTDRKMEVISEGKSPAQVLAEGIGAAMRERKTPVVISDVELHKYIVGRVKGRVFDSKLDLRKACLSAGVKIYRGRGDGRWAFPGGTALAIVNAEAWKVLDAEGGEIAVVQRLYRALVGGIGSLIEEEM